MSVGIERLLLFSTNTNIFWIVIQYLHLRLSSMIFLELLEEYNYCPPTQ